jgi:hypothetical protein
MSLYKINKYLYKLKNTDISSDEFNIYLQKLNKYYLQHGGLFNIKKRKTVPLNNIITHQTVLSIEIPEIIQNVENFFTNFVFNDFIGIHIYFSLKYICIPKISQEISQKILLWGYYKSDEIYKSDKFFVSSVHVIYNSLTNENKNNIYIYIIESYLNTFINETKLASKLYKIVSDYSNFQKKNLNLNWGFETVYLSFSFSKSDVINVTIHDNRTTNDYINESVTLNQILNYIKTEIKLFKNPKKEDFEEIYNKTIEIVGQYSGNPEEAMTKFILKFEKISADILKIKCPTNIIIIDGLIDKTPINHLYNIKKISGNTQKKECPLYLYYTNTLKKSSTINLSETSIVHFFKNNLLNYNCIYKYMDDFLQKIQQDNIDKIQENQQIFIRPVKNNNGQIKKDNDGQIKKDNSVPIKKDNRVNIKQKIQEIFMVWILYLSNSTQKVKVFTNFDNILIYDNLSQDDKLKYKNTRDMLYKAVQCVFLNKDKPENCLNNYVIEQINQCNESNESSV